MLGDHMIDFRELLQFIQWQWPCLEEPRIQRGMRILRLQKAVQRSTQSDGSTVVLPTSRLIPYPFLGYPTLCL